MNHAPTPTAAPGPTLVIPLTGPVPPMFAPVVEVADGVYAAGLHFSPEAARSAGDALQTAHQSLTMRCVVELVTIGVVELVAGAYDELETDPAALGGAA